MNNKIKEIDIYSSQDEYQRFSVSKIKTYKECSQMYNLKYVQKLSCYKESTSTFVGTLVHAALEYLYGVEDDSVVSAKDAFFKILADEFAKKGISSTESILGDLLEYYEDINNLYLRASAAYNGKDAIRTGNGSVPKVPEMTSTWKAECKKLDLDNRKARIDYIIQTSKNGMEEVSITDVFSKALTLVSNYVTPPEFMEILHLELPLSEWNKDTNTLINPVPFPECEFPNVYLNGYIDNIAKVIVNGKLITAVIDYKTSKEEFNESIVAHNQQLLIYAAGVEELLGIEVDYIGILSLIKGNLVLVPVDKEIQSKVIQGFNGIIKKIFDNDFHKHYPDTKYSACLNSFGSTCPFLKECWPKSYEYFHETGLEDDFFASYL
jgi:hypothetical protein